MTARALGLFYNPNNGVFAELKGGRLRVYGPKETLADQEWKASAAHLKIINRRHSVEFMASENGRDWQRLAAGFDASGFTTNVLHGFQALRRAGGERRRGSTLHHLPLPRPVSHRRSQMPSEHTVPNILRETIMRIRPHLLLLLLLHCSSPRSHVPRPRRISGASCPHRSRCRCRAPRRCRLIVCALTTRGTCR